MEKSDVFAVLQDVYGEYLSPEDEDLETVGRYLETAADSLCSNPNLLNPGNFTELTDQLSAQLRTFNQNLALAESDSGSEDSDSDMDTQTLSALGEHVTPVNIKRLGIWQERKASPEKQKKVSTACVAHARQMAEVLKHLQNQNLLNSYLNTILQKGYKQWQLLSHLHQQNILSQPYVHIICLQDFKHWDLLRINGVLDQAHLDRFNRVGGSATSNILLIARILDINHLFEQPDCQRRLGTIMDRVSAPVANTLSDDGNFLYSIFHFLNQVEGLLRNSSVWEDVFRLVRQVGAFHVLESLTLLSATHESLENEPDILDQTNWDILSQVADRISTPDAWERFNKALLYLGKMSLLEDHFDWIARHAAAFSTIQTTQILQDLDAYTAPSEVSRFWGGLIRGYGQNEVDIQQLINHIKSAASQFVAGLPIERQRGMAFDAIFEALERDRNTLYARGERIGPTSPSPFWIHAPRTSSNPQEAAPILAWMRNSPRGA